MSESEFHQRIFDKLEKLELKIDAIDTKSERSWRAIVGDEATHSKGLGVRVEQAETDIGSLKKDRTKAGALIGAALMVLGAFGAKIIEYLRS